MIIPLLLFSIFTQMGSPKLADDSVHQDISSFYNWWEGNRATIDTTTQLFFRHKQFKYKNISKRLLDIKSINSPRLKISPFLGITCILDSSDQYVIGLLVPKDSCNDKLTLLVIPSLYSVSKVDINPYCSDSYTDEEVDIILYWIVSEQYPLIEFITNGPACVPHYLFKYDPKTNKYLLVRKKCTS